MNPSTSLRALGAVFALGLAAAPVAGQTPDYAAEIAALAAHPAVQRAMEVVEARDAVTMSDLRELTQIPAPPFMETARGVRFREMLEEAGVDSTWVDDEGNVIGLRRGSGRGDVIAITGHLDTVFPEETDLTIHERGDTLYAPGIADDTRGLAALLAILRAMNEADVSTAADILFVGTVGEEGLGDLRGVKHLFREGGPQIDAFISIDGTGHQGITHQALGSYRYRVTIEGPGGHSWGAFGLGESAARARACHRALRRGGGRHHPGRPPHELQRRRHRRRHLGELHPLRGLDGSRHALGEPGEPGPDRRRLPARHGAGGGRGERHPPRGRGAHADARQDRRPPLR